jgi:ubiquinone/menaquinone biosynthesis C-methylase UbiE
MVDRLLSDVAREGGRILDVACGHGASTMRLARHYTPEGITAINISEARPAPAPPAAAFAAWMRRGSRLRTRSSMP